MNKPAVRFCPVAPFLMKYIIFIILSFISLAIMAKQISELSWEKRLLVISYEKQDDLIFTKTKKFISDNKCEIEDRNLEIIFYEKFENKDYSKPEFINNKYGIWLIGYDGMIKDSSSDDKIFLRLFDLIDSMPMRKDEMINNKC
tara:strand:+ start:223 stop:654 length:432 start_codon:yes stop_codon:yes gene_type:complete